MATQDGLEPTTSAVTGRHSNQLNYWAEYVLCQISDRIICYHIIAFLASNITLFLCWQKSFSHLCGIIHSVIYGI